MKSDYTYCTSSQEASSWMSVTIENGSVCCVDSKRSDLPGECILNLPLWWRPYNSEKKGTFYLSCRKRYRPNSILWKRTFCSSHLLLSVMLVMPLRQQAALPVREFRRPLLATQVGYRKADTWHGHPQNVIKYMTHNNVCICQDVVFLSS